LAVQFHYRGGIVKPTPHTVEKFLLFFVVSGKEIPIYRLQQDSLILRPNVAEPDMYTSGNNIAKLFMVEAGFGIPKRYYSFYMRILDESEPHPIITVKPLSGDPTGFYFQAKANFMKKSQVLSLLDAEESSVPFIKRQALPPVDLLRKLITVDKSELRKNVRHVRIGKKKGGEL